MTYDADGNVLSFTVSEPRFTPDDKLLLLASRRASNIPRSRSGVALADATDPSKQYAWKVDLPVTDFAQAKLNAARESYKKQYPDADMDSLLWRVEEA